MNSIDEQCLNSDSEIELSQKTGSKLSQVHRAPNLAQTAHIGARAHAVSWPQRRRVTGPSLPCHGRLALCRG